MDRIDRLLQELLIEQDVVTVTDSPFAKDRRDALRNEIAADFRAMVEALEEVEWLPWYYHGTRRGKRCPWCIHLQTNGHSDDCQRQALLARVKGE